MHLCVYGFSICQPPFDRIHMEDHATMFTYRKALSPMWTDSYCVCTYVCMCVHLCVYGCCSADAHSSEQERLQLSSPPITHWEHLCCVCMCAHTISHFHNLCVCECVYILCSVCVCVRCVCVRSVYSPRKALGLQAAWWQCRWDNIWHVSDWVSVCMHVCVCVCISVHLGSPLIERGSLCSLWPTGEPAGQQRVRESSKACLPSASLTSSNSFATVVLYRKHIWICIQITRFFVFKGFLKIVKTKWNSFFKFKMYTLCVVKFLFDIWLQFFY